MAFVGTYVSLFHFETMFQGQAVWPALGNKYWEKRGQIQNAVLIVML